MTKNALASTAVALALAAAFGTTAASDDDDDDGDGKSQRRVRARLSGFNEYPATLSSTGRGSFRAVLSKDESTITFRLSYEDLEGNVTVAHIHFGDRHTLGGVSAWLCGGGGKPACPAPGGTVEGTIVAADVVGPAAQGIAAGELDELVRAIRRGVAYVNVHSDLYPGGEIRGQIKAD